MKTRTKRRLAIFDIDGTIFRSGLGVEAFYALVEAKVLPNQALTELIKDYHAWLNRHGTYENYIWKMVGIFLKYIKGVEERRVHRVITKVIYEHKDRVYRYTRSLIRTLRSRNYYLLAISGSPSFVVEPFSKYLKFDEFYATTYVVKAGRFTGEGKEAGGPSHKKALLAAFLESHKGEFDLKRSIAVGDTTSDVPLLEAVGRPIAFNPNIELAKIARRRGWRLVVERKDVIYELKKPRLISL